MKKEYALCESGIARTDNEIKTLAKSKAYQSFDEVCIAPIKKVDRSIPCVCVSGEDSSISTAMISP